MAPPVQREPCSGKQYHSELRVISVCVKGQRSYYVVSTGLGRWKQAKAAPDPTVLCELLPSRNPSPYHSCFALAQQWPSTGGSGESARSQKSLRRFWCEMRSRYLWLKVLFVLRKQLTDNQDLLLFFFNGCQSQPCVFMAMSAFYSFR